MTRQKDKENLARALRNYCEAEMSRNRRTSDKEGDEPTGWYQYELDAGALLRLLFLEFDSDAILALCEKHKFQGFESVVKKIRELHDETKGLDSVDDHNTGIHNGEKDALPTILHRSVVGGDAAIYLNGKRKLRWDDQLEDAAGSDLLAVLSDAAKAGLPIVFEEDRQSDPLPKEL